MKPLISILIPTIRTPVYIVEFLKASPCPMLYEIVVGTSNLNFSLDGIDKVVYLKQEKGSAYCINKLFQASEGDYIYAMTDDNIMTDGWWQVTKELDDLDYQHKVLSLGISRCPLPNAWGPLWDLHGVDTGLNPAFYTAVFPAFRRDTVENLLDGIIFNESYYHHHADIWLGHYLATMGEPVRNSQTTHVQQLNVPFAQGNNYVHDQHDEKTCHLMCNKLNKEWFPYSYRMYEDPNFDFSQIIHELPWSI